MMSMDILITWTVFLVAAVAVNVQGAHSAEKVLIPVRSDKIPKEAFMIQDFRESGSGAVYIGDVAVYAPAEVSDALNQVAKEHKTLRTIVYSRRSLRYHKDLVDVSSSVLKWCLTNDCDCIVMVPGSGVRGTGAILLVRSSKSVVPLD